MGRLVVAQEPRARREHRVRARLDAGSRSAAGPRTTSRSTATTSPRRRTRGWSRGATASGSRTSARRTAPSSTASGSRRPRKLTRRRPRARRRDRPQVRGMIDSDAAPASPTPGASAAATRTPGSASRRSSRSPTAWAARKGARSPRALAATALGESVDGSGEERVVALDPGGEPAGLRPRAQRTRTPRAWARRSPSRSSRTASSRSATSATRAPTWSATSKLEQLTDDHSLVAELVRSGKLSPEEAEIHPQRSVITRALGTDPDVDVDTFSVEARPGDLFFICSDGLTSMVDDETILDVVEQRRDDLDAAAKELVGAANRSGGEDNITVVFFEIDRRRRRARRPRRRRCPSLAGEPAAERRGRRGHALRARARPDGRHDGRPAEQRSPTGSRGPARAGAAEGALRRPGRAARGRARGRRGARAARLLAARPEPDEPAGTASSSTSSSSRSSPGLGFASVYIARQEVVSTGSLSYALFFFALYVAAHVSRGSRCRRPIRTCCRWPRC